MIMLNCLPLMNKNIAARFMKIIEGVLNNPADNSIFKHNINPLRVGLMLYRVIDDVQQEYGYSENSTTIMKDLCSEQIKSTMEMYNDPDELMIIVEQTDYEGNDCFWYLDEYDLYNILDCRIMDRVIQKKWAGKFELNSSIMDYASSYTLLMDKFGLYANDTVFAELKHQVLSLDRSDETHQFKFHVWKYSMQLRFQVSSYSSFF